MAGSGTLKESTGKHFDPEGTATFFEIYEVIRAIREKYTG
jgi:hypothetical protein